MMKLYGNPISQPTRAVMWMLAIKQVKYEFVPVNPMAGETSSDEFLAKFPAGAIPAIEDTVTVDGKEQPFYLTEGGAILTYLAAKHGWADYYPTELHRRAVVDQWLHWHHSNTRNVTMCFVRPLFFGGTPEEVQAKCAEGTKVLEEDVFPVMKWGGLTKSKFLCGDEPTLADVATYCEMDQLIYMGMYNFDKHPEVQQWLQRMRELPFHDEVRKPLADVVEQMKAKK